MFANTLANFKAPLPDAAGAKMNENKFFSKEDCFKEISMGMSGDYLLAIEEGSTMVRVGSSIFGTR